MSAEATELRMDFSCKRNCYTAWAGNWKNRLATYDKILNVGRPMKRFKSIEQLTFRALVVRQTTVDRSLFTDYVSNSVTANPTIQHRLNYRESLSCNSLLITDFDKEDVWFSCFLIDQHVVLSVMCYGLNRSTIKVAIRQSHDRFNFESSVYFICR